jgi:hypothetical protein
MGLRVPHWTKSGREFRCGRPIILPERLGSSDTLVAEADAQRSSHPSGTTTSINSDIRGRRGIVSGAAGGHLRRGIGIGSAGVYGDVLQHDLDGAGAAAAGRRRATPTDRADPRRDGDSACDGGDGAGVLEAEASLWVWGRNQLPRAPTCTPEGHPRVCQSGKPRRR